MGWFVDEYGMAQVTVNLNNYRVTPLHLLFEEVKREAEALHVAVAGSEIVGIVPLESILMAADYYIEREGLFLYEEGPKIRLAIERMGLNSVATFVPEKKIIEYIVAEPPDEPLASLSVRRFIEEIAARTSAPGGGSASAAMAAIGTGLGAMVAKLTQGVRKFETVEPQMQKSIPVLHGLTRELIPMIDADTSAFNDYMEGSRMPQDTPEEQAARTARMQAGLKTAIQVPMAVMRLGDRAWDALCEVAKYGNPASRSDVQVGAKALENGIWGAFQNVMINMTDVSDPAFKDEIMAEARAIETRARIKCGQVLEILDNI
jgi:glutamate formiminotransferase/formiminotetrahydrofolate cyclodeaminase